MNLKELDSFKLHDAVFFHDELNPSLFDGDRMNPDVRDQLLIIAEDFIDHLGLDDVKVEDVTISGSNAAYSYTDHSDIDLHILVDMDKMNNDIVYRELFDAKKTVYNDTHDIIVNGYDVELYVQDINQPHISLGEYSVMNDSWKRLPKKTRAHLDQYAAKAKYDKLLRLAKLAFKYSDEDKMYLVLKTLKKYRQAGLDMKGEFSPENLAYKALRNKGVVKKLYDKYNQLHSERLSLNAEKELDEMEIGDVASTVGMMVPGIGPAVKAYNVGKSLYNAGKAAVAYRDASRDLDAISAQQASVPRTPQITTYNPDYIDKDMEPVQECTGYIPSEKEKNDWRWKTALTVDITPYTMQTNAKKLGSKIQRDGRPPLLRP